MPRSTRNDSWKLEKYKKDLKKMVSTALIFRHCLYPRRFQQWGSLRFSVAAGLTFPPMDKNQVLIYLNAFVYIKPTTLTLTMQFLKYMTVFSYNLAQGWKIIWNLQKQLTNTEQYWEQRTIRTPKPPFLFLDTIQGINANM